MEEHNQGRAANHSAGSGTVKKEIKEWIKSIALAVALAIVIRMFFLEVFLVEGTSMFPTLEHQERLIVNKAVYHFREPERKEIVVFNYSPSRDFIKRVAAQEGEEVELRNGRLYVDGRSLQEPYLKESTREDVGDYGPAVVPEGHLFVLGDNRSNSMDSRDEAVGFVSLEQVKGKAFFVFWPPANMRMLGL